MARRYPIQCSLPNTHTVYLNWTAGGRHAGREAGKERVRIKDEREGARGGWGREGARGGSEEVVMGGRVGAGVEEGREG